MKKDNEHIVKNIRQYSVCLSGENYEKLMTISERYNNVKNYVYGRYSGIGSISLLKGHRKEIRDKWVENGFAKQWKLPARYWKVALDDAVGQLKSKWSNIKLDCKKWYRRNGKSMNVEESHLFFYLLKSDTHLLKILNQHRKIDLPEKFSGISLKKKNSIFRLVRRLIRKHSGKKPKTDKKSFSIDADMYSYNDGCIEIMSFEPNRRIPLKVNTNGIFTGTLRLSFDRDKVTINMPLLVKKNTKKNTGDEIGIDKNYQNVVASSSGKVYGDGINKASTKYAETLCEINKKRNQFRDIIKKYEEIIEKKSTSEKDKKFLNQKIGNINKNNLGTQKYNKTKERLSEGIHQETNKALNQLIREEAPRGIISEDLTKTFGSHKERGKKFARLMASWAKGYLRDRLEYKAELNNIPLTAVNAAYSSQSCSDCECYGIRLGDNFYCPVCGKVEPAHINAGKVVKNRKYDKEIGLYTPFAEVRKIIVKRTIAVAGDRLKDLLPIYLEHGIDLLKGYWGNQDFGCNTPKSELQKNIPILSNKQI